MESEPAATPLQPRCPLLAAPWVYPGAQRDGTRAVVVAQGAGTSCTPPKALFCARRSNVAGRNQRVLCSSPGCPQTSRARGWSGATPSCTAPAIKFTPLLLKL